MGDPYSPAIRATSAKQVLAEAERLRTEHRCDQAVLMGDWNADCVEEAYTTCSDAGWVDALPCVEGPYAPGSFTYHEFKGSAHCPKGAETSDHDMCIDFIWLW